MVPKVTVIMAVYNGENYLRESVQSILDQTLRDLELIIVDDNSSDRTPDIINEYKEIDPRVSVLRNDKNLGPYRSSNKGIDMARASYIARQDADDISMPGRLNKQFNFLEQNKDYACAGSFYNLVDSDGNTKYKINLPIVDGEIRRWLKSVNPICHGSIMFRKDCARRVGFYPELYRYSQDYVFLYNLSKIFKLTNIPEFLYKLRSHPRSTSTFKKVEQWKAVFMIKKDLGLLESKDISFSKFISDELFRYGVFYYNMKMKKMALNSLLVGAFYKMLPFNIDLQKEKQLGICMVVGSYYPEISGSGLQCKTLIDSLQSKNLRFYIITTTRDSLLSNKDSDRLIFRIKLGRMNLLDKFKGTMDIFFTFLKLRKNIDMVHLHGFSRKTILIILLAKLFRKKIIQKMTSLGEDDPLSLNLKSFGKLNRFFFLKADLFISINPKMSEWFSDTVFPGNRLLTIPNGVDTDRFCPAKDLSEKMVLREKLNLPQDVYIILFVGFFSKEKAPDILFEAYKTIRQKADKDVYLLFVGSTRGDYFEIDNSLANIIKEEAKNLDVEKNIIFVEKTLEIEEYYRVSDIFVLPSLRVCLTRCLKLCLQVYLAFLLI